MIPAEHAKSLLNPTQGQQTNIIGKFPPSMVVPSKSAYLKKRLVMSGGDKGDDED
jgi:hypothetical protein